MTGGADGFRAGFESRTVWIFGSPRSGTTWLLEMLSENPLVVTMDEPTIGNHLSPFATGEPGISLEDLDFDTFTLRKVMADRDSRFFSDAYRDVWVPGIRRLINDRFIAHVERSASGAPHPDTRLVVKEPNGSQAADVIMECQPDASLVFLLRDGRDVVDSELAAIGKGGWLERHFEHVRGVGDDERLEFVVQAAFRWLWRTQTVEQAVAAHGANAVMLRYEEMLDAPEEHLARVADAIDLRLDRDEIERVVARFGFDRIAVRGPQEFFRSASPGAWRENLRPEEQQALERILGPKLRELGYA